MILVGLFNNKACLWVFDSAVALLGEVAAVGHADDGKAKGERREEKPDEPQPALARRASLCYGRVDHERGPRACLTDDWAFSYGGAGEAAQGYWGGLHDSSCSSHRAGSPRFKTCACRSAWRFRFPPPVFCVPASYCLKWLYSSQYRLGKTSPLRFLHVRSTAKILPLIRPFGPDLA